MANLPDPKYQRLIIKYLSQEISLNEDNELRHWVDQSEDNALFFDEIYELWESLKTMPEAKAPTLEVSWKDLEKELNKTPLGQKRKKNLGNFSLRMAVALLGVLGTLTFLGYWVTRNPSAQAQNFPAPDIYLDGNNYSFEFSSKSFSLTSSPIILNPKQAVPDSIFIQKQGGKWIFSTKTGPFLIRNKQEQAILRNNRKLTYQPDKGFFVY